MEKEYQTKVMKPSVEKKEKKEDLPIFMKRQHWCFRLKGTLYKFPTEAEAKTKYLELK
jgi:hypothetical protein